MLNASEIILGNYSKGQVHPRRMGQKQVFKHGTIPIPFCRQTLAFPLRPTPRSVEAPSATNSN